MFGEINKIHVNNSTHLTLNDRFTYLRKSNSTNANKKLVKRLQIKHNKQMTALKVQKQPTKKKIIQNKQNKSWISARGRDLASRLGGSERVGRQLTNRSTSQVNSRSRSRTRAPRQNENLPRNNRAGSARSSSRSRPREYNPSKPRQILRGISKRRNSQNNLKKQLNFKARNNSAVRRRINERGSSTVRQQANSNRTTRKSRSRTRVIRVSDQGNMSNIKLLNNGRMKKTTLRNKSGARSAGNVKGKKVNLKKEDLDQELDQYMQHLN